MGDFNKVVSFVLGLIVVVVFLAVVTGRLNLRQRILSDTSKKTVAPTATPTPTPKNSEKKGFFSFLSRSTPTPTPTVFKLRPTPVRQPTVITNYKTGAPIIIASPTPTAPRYTASNQTKGGNDISSIPSTGADTALIPFALSSLAAGLYLRRKK